MKIFVTRKIPDAGLNLLKKNYELELNPFNRILSKKEIIKHIDGKDGLLCLLTDQIDKEVILSEPKIRIIANYAVGYDNINVKIATKARIPVCNTPGVLTDATAEMAWALLFSTARRIVEGDSFTKTGKFEGWDPLLMLGHGISGKTLGIIGAGRIGSAFGLKSKGFNMNVLYSDDNKNNILETNVNAKKVHISELIMKSDFISIHLPLNKSTYHIIGKKEFEIMKENVIIVNTSRGSVIDEKMLIQALKEKRIFGAGLDVYENEPNINNKLRQLKNVVLQPHSASATFKSRTDMSIIAAKNLIKGLEGEIPPNCINKEVFFN